jgi:DNA-directed RNA polymerase specialized sigma24 family protein
MGTLIPLNTIAPRSAEFDKQLLAYMPGLYRNAVRMTRRTSSAKVLLDATVEAMLKRHQSCRMETFYTWAILVMRNVASTLKEERGRLKRQGISVDMEEAGELPECDRQSSFVEVADVVRFLRGRKGGDILVRRAMGEGIDEIASDIGMSRSGVHAAEQRERAAVLARFGATA